MLTKINERIMKFTGTDKVNCYLIDGRVMVDCGNPDDKEKMREEMKEWLDKVEVVVFTHMHYDHMGNFDLFSNAKFYASVQEIEDFKKVGFGAVFDTRVLNGFDKELIELGSEIYGMKVIGTPGHTRGSVSLWWAEEKVLFTGDTWFGPDRHGRLDLPTSVPAEMEKSLEKLKEFEYDIFCPGHDYC